MRQIPQSSVWSLKLKSNLDELRTLPPTTQQSSPSLHSTHLKVFQAFPQDTPSTSSDATLAIDIANAHVRALVRRTQPRAVRDIADRLLPLRSFALDPSLRNAVEAVGLGGREGLRLTGMQVEADTTGEGWMGGIYGGGLRRGDRKRGKGEMGDEDLLTAIEFRSANEKIEGEK